MVTPSEGGARRSRVVQWVLLEGSRLAVTAMIVAAVAVLTYALIRLGVLAVGPSSSIPTMLGSGGLAGLVTLLTITLSINQLTLSRLFGSPDSLSDRLEGTLDFRRSVEELAGEHESPNDPGDFLALVARTLRDEVDGLAEAVEGGESAGEFEPFTAAVADYADGLAEVGGSDSTVDVLSMLLGPAYADNMTVALGLQRAHGDELGAAASDRLARVVDLLQAIAISRQFFKTIAVQQDLARLSRRLIYSGLAAVVAVIYLTLAYTSSSVTLPSAYLPVVVTVVITLLVVPLAQISSTLLRVATVSMYSVSVGPFVPPEERSG